MLYLRLLHLANPVIKITHSTRCASLNFGGKKSLCRSAVLSHSSDSPQSCEFSDHSGVEKALQFVQDAVSITL